MDLYNEKLNQIKSDKEQYEAYLSEDSTVVIAGPGSGKTTVLTLKILRLLKEYIRPPRGLACVTFSKAAAKEIKDRLNAFGYQQRDNVFLGTVHSFCISEIISPFAHLYNYDIPLPLRIVSEKKRKSLFKQIISDFELEHLGLSIEEMDKERTLNIEGISEVEVPTYDLALRVAIEYEKRLHTNGLVDFVDIVKYATTLIQNQEYVRKCLEAKFPWVLIDEYQDLGKPLHEMVLSLFYKTNIKIFAVGDPDQSIHGYNGAIPDYLIELYHNPSITQIQLKTNYRSNQDIIDASELALQDKRGYKAGARLGENAEFHFITCEEEMFDQYVKVAKEIIPSCREAGIPLEEIAIMVGSNKHAKELGRILDESGVPFYITKFDFQRSDVVLWLERCAIWCVDKSKQSFNELVGFWINLHKIHDRPLLSKEQILFRRRLFDTLTSSIKHIDDLGKWLTFVVNELELSSLLTDSPVYPDELENLNKLMKLTIEGEFRDYDLSKFGKLGKPGNQVTITTRHGSKGLEFEVVILLGMEEDHFPSYWNKQDEKRLSEEHRVFFVCVSRAKRVCYLLRSQKYTKKTKYGLKKFDYAPSRFWELLYARYGEKTHV
ncbi:ATP-dependent helicase [Anoxybacillus flavithermus]|uniref:DNA 3'-5' helicase n=1 Tax=Anoxybacillus flavithermus (strain DSM 21510 / WK1) TaxID=491915 RepID=B7GM56_ANOFW|nr:ATP-dependent helicase [Anoxybacillus flavithermus]ACJ34594.1 ATP-dependent DNA helicase [Anoxybacillus flavithermus WK1]